MVADLAFVPISDVERYFSALKESAPEEMSDFVEWFDRTYVTVAILNQYDAIINSQSLSSFGGKKSS